MTKKSYKRKHTEARRQSEDRQETNDCNPSVDVAKLPLSHQNEKVIEKLKVQNYSLSQEIQTKKQEYPSIKTGNFSRHS
jgi:hypothetical protein